MRKYRSLLGLVIAACVLGAALPAAAGDWESFGRCLKSRGATFYGASWCSHCRAQRQTLGPAMDYVRYVECSVDGARDETAAPCRKAGIDGYPTWVFADGSQAGGEQSIARLAAKTGCTPPANAAGSTTKTDRGTQRPKSGHAKVIEVH